MNANHLAQKAAVYLNKLCVEIKNRCTGSSGNQAATDFFTEMISAFGFETERPLFDCLDWRQAGAELTAAGQSFPVLPSPYTVGCRVNGPLAVVRSVEQLTAVDLTGKILLLLGEIAAEQLMPKNFPFYNPDHHQLIYQLLESKQPQAIIAATGQDLQMVGGQYPFPLFEDGDFDIPSVYLKDVEGERLAAHAGREANLEIRAQRISAVGSNVIARKGRSSSRRVVLLAHIDAKMHIPGALDNAAGVVVMLLLAELLAAYNGALGIEIVAVNGEDYYSSPGERQYLALNEGQFSDIVLGINVDGVGYHQGKTAYSLYNCPGPLARTIEAVLGRFDNIVAGVPWYAGDHGIFLMNQVPALAFTSEQVAAVMAEIVHTKNDTPAVLNPTLLVETAQALHDLLLHLAQEAQSRHNFVHLNEAERLKKRRP